MLAPPVATAGGGGARAAGVGTAGTLPVVADRVALAGVVLTSFSFSPALDTRARPMVNGMTEDAAAALDFLFPDDALLPDLVESSSLFFFFFSSVGSTVTRSTLTTSSSSNPSES